MYACAAPLIKNTLLTLMLNLMLTVKINAVKALLLLLRHENIDLNSGTAEVWSMEDVRYGGGEPTSLAENLPEAPAGLCSSSVTC